MSIITTQQVTTQQQMTTQQMTTQEQVTTQRYEISSSNESVPLSIISIIVIIGTLCF